MDGASLTVADGAGTWACPYDGMGRPLAPLTATRHGDVGGGHGSGT